MRRGGLFYAPCPPSVDDKRVRSSQRTALPRPALRLGREAEIQLRKIQSRALAQTAKDIDVVVVADRGARGDDAVDMLMISIG